MLKDLLSELDRDQLQSLLLKLTEREPGLSQVIEELIGSQKSTSPKELLSPAATSSQPMKIDTKAIRREVHSTLHSLDRMSASEAYWHVGGVVDEVRQSLEQVWTLIQENDGRNALSLLETITDEYVSGWEDLDDSEEESVVKDLSHPAPLNICQKCD